MANFKIKDYFSTVEAAKYCKVTRFTIINWVKNGLIKATRTIGGHRRILRDDLISFMQIHNMGIRSVDLQCPEIGFKWCWEFYQNDGYKNHKCRGCLVYLTHAKKCFELREKVGHRRVFCSSSCKDCSYYKEYFNNFQWCWEFYQNGGQADHECQKCIVYLTGTKRCFTLREETDHKKIFCKRNCTECSYYQKFTISRNVITNIKNNEKPYS